MKMSIRNTLIFFLAVLFFGSCINVKKENENSENKEVTVEQSKADNQPNNPTLVRCNTMEVLEKHISKKSELRVKMQTIEKKCQAFIKSEEKNKRIFLDTIAIPVVVHVLYNNETENISDEQIQSQITVLNQDFTKTNTDFSKVPEEFKSIAAEVNIRFSIDSIVRLASARAEWGTDDEMKFSSSGGSDVIAPETKLNIWVCTIGGGILGYAQFPGDTPTTDGIVINPQFFGTTGSVTSPFNKGRTATHEVGHWLNLRHIWGDGNCSQDDFIEDTPLSDGPNYGCPEYPLLRCDSNDNTMNYMDYTDDGCMYMFTKGQKDRMRAVFAEGMPREGFVK